MTARSSRNRSEAGNARGLPRLVLDDFRSFGWRQSIRQDLRDLYRFYLDEDERARLAGMGRVRRFLHQAGWLGRSLLVRLSPARRLLLVLALVLLVWSPYFRYKDVQLTFSTWPWIALILLLVLALELKDKLLARDEIEIARRVQRSLMPVSYPAVAGWSVWGSTTAANTVGGDLVDHIDLPGGRFGFALGDVAGKGLGAALLAAQLQATLRALAPEVDRLDRLAEKMNAILLRDGLDNRFATLIYAEIRAGARRLRCVNAGHNAPFLLRDGEFRTVPASGPPLGVVPHGGYVEFDEEFRPGDLLIAYSDGISEALSPDGAEWGEERLRASILRARDLPVADLGRAILDDVGRFLGGERPHDDQSLVILRAEG